jgi:hypothetical protein
MTLSRAIALTYAAIVGLTAMWACYVDMTLLHSPREHLLPDITLAYLSLPASLSLGPMYDLWPALFSKPFTQLAWITLCGVVQAAALFLLASLSPSNTRKFTRRR